MCLTVACISSTIPAVSVPGVIGVDGPDRDELWYPLTPVMNSSRVPRDCESVSQDGIGIFRFYVRIRKGRCETHGL